MIIPLGIEGFTYLGLLKIRLAWQRQKKIGFYEQNNSSAGASRF